MFFTGLVLVYVFYFLLGWSPAPLGRLDVFYSAPPAVTGFYLIDALLARRPRDLPLCLQSVDPAGANARDLLAGADRADDARLDAVGTGVRFCAHRARQRTVADHRDRYLRLPHAMLPVITTLSMVFLVPARRHVLVEKVFAWPGIGSYAVEALISSDFAPVQGFVLTMAVMYVLLNLMIDILYGVIDPRVRLEG